MQTTHRRGSRFLSAEDLIFLIRHDRPKVNRLRTFLSWKDVRKNVKDKDGGGPTDAEELMEDGVGKERNNNPLLPPLHSLPHHRKANEG